MEKFTTPHRRRDAAASAATSTPTRSSRPSTSSGSRAPASRTASSPPGATTRTSCSTSPSTPPASVLVAGPDFGTGSSREHAVWALQNYGFKVVISSRFADIFRGNSGKSGLLAAQVDEKVVQQLWDHLEDAPRRDRDRRPRVAHGRAGDGPDAIEDSFDIDDYTRWRLLEGLDDIGITLGHDDDIAAYESRRPSWKPVTQH